MVQHTCDVCEKKLNPSYDMIDGQLQLGMDHSVVHISSIRISFKTDGNMVGGNPDLCRKCAAKILRNKLPEVKIME